MIQVEFDVITCSDIPVNAWHVLGALIGLEFICMDLPMFGSQRRICSRTRFKKDASFVCHSQWGDLGFVM